MERRQRPLDQTVASIPPVRIPVDLAVCYLWLAGTLLCVYLPVLSDTSVRILVGVPMLLFIPGYALTAVLFPAAGEVDGIERVALSFGLSLAIAPLTGLGLNYTPWGIRLTPVLIGLCLLTVLFCCAAQYRRAQLPPGERFVVPFETLLRDLADEYLPRTAHPRTERVLSILLLVVIIGVAVTTVSVFAYPKEGEAFTGFVVLGADQGMADYPTRLALGENRSVFLEISNHEHRPVTYTVETFFMNVTSNETAVRPLVSAMTRIDRVTVPVAADETLTLPYHFAPGKTGFNRIEFLLFNESVPDDAVWGTDRIDQSIRDLHLGISIKAP